jgi:hypothetical protein
MTADLAANAIRTVIVEHQPDGAVMINADRGAQFRARSFQHVSIRPIAIPADGWAA